MASCPVRLPPSSDHDKHSGSGWLSDKYSTTAMVTSCNKAVSWRIDETQASGCNTTLIKTHKTSESDAALAAW